MRTFLGFGLTLWLRLLIILRAAAKLAVEQIVTPTVWLIVPTFYRIVRTDSPGEFIVVNLSASVTSHPHAAAPSNISTRAHSWVNQTQRMVA